MRFTFLCACALLISFSAQAQRVTISGYVEEAASAEKLIGATVFEATRGVGAVTNRYGFFSLTLPPGPAVLTFRYVGLRADTLRLDLQRDTSLIVRLEAASQALGDLVVEAERQEAIEESSRMGVMEIPVAQIEKLPAFLGEVDVLKVLQLLPGVQSGAEGTSGLYVRGGGPDQNLILLDGVPVYNASHLFGFFSVFNADAIKNVELSKGGFPARYGGRLSSVIEIGMKEGNMRAFAAKGSIGLVASRLTLEGPIWKGRTSYVLSGRRTYLDLIARPFMEDDAKAGYYFYDLNAKVNHIFSPQNRVYLSLYGGDDRFWSRTRDSFSGQDQESRANFGWGNLTSALRWNHVPSGKLFVNTTLTFSRYAFDVGAEEEENNPPPQPSQTFRLAYLSGIRDVGARVDVDYFPSPNHYIRVGGGATHHTFRPGRLQFREMGTFNADTTIASRRTEAVELMAYAEDDVRLTRFLKANVGVHASAFAVDGRTYTSLQPRLSLRLLTGVGSFKASFVTMQQYIHLLSNQGVGLPTDLWVPATDRVPPQSAWQASAGVARTQGPFEISVEGYYKAMDGLIIYRDGAGFTAPGADWQEDVLTGGTGTSYGAELLVQRKSGRTTGWIGYTLAWTDRQFETVNGGQPFPYRYDRRHDLSMVVTHTLSNAFDVSAAWVYGTGVAATLARGRYRSTNEDGQSYYDVLETYGARNSFRMPAYHRLDLSANWFIRRGPRERVLSLSVYNAYNRKNPFFAEVTSDDTYDPRTGQYRRGDPYLKGYALFPVIPSLAFRFSF